MESKLFSFWFGQRGNHKCYKEENQRLQCNLGMLRKTLNSRQKRLLLHILDDKDAITEKATVDSYINGFRMGTKIMIECLYVDHIEI